MQSMGENNAENKFGSSPERCLPRREGYPLMRLKAQSRIKIMKMKMKNDDAAEADEDDEDKD